MLLGELENIGALSIVAPRDMSLAYPMMPMTASAFLATVRYQLAPVAKHDRLGEPFASGATHAWLKDALADLDPMVRTSPVKVHILLLQYQPALWNDSFVDRDGSSTVLIANS